MKNQLTKSNPEILRGVNLPGLMPIRVKLMTYDFFLLHPRTILRLCVTVEIADLCCDWLKDEQQKVEIFVAQSVCTLEVSKSFICIKA